MTTSTTRPEARSERRAHALRSLLAVAFWLVVWQVVAVVVDERILLVTPVAVVQRLAELVPTGAFWLTVLHTVGRIALGFLAAAAVGVLSASAASASRVVDALLAPVVSAIRSTPVVSFIILVLIWADSARLAAIVSFLMVLPVVHTAVLEGLRHRSPSLAEVGEVFAVPWGRRVVALDVPQVLPFFVAACRTGVGLAWKSGVAAEVIGLPAGSIGEQLYQAKIFLATADLFAWTLVIVTLAHLAERLVVGLLDVGERRLAGVVA